MHITIVEDNQALLSMLKTVLALKGYIVETYNNASSFLWALQKAESTSPFKMQTLVSLIDEITSSVKI